MACIFADSRFGDTEAALAAARRWRDAHPWYGQTHENDDAPQLDGNAPSPPELTRCESLLPGHKIPSAFWCARWTDSEGQNWTRKFSVNHWGEEVARQKAQAIHAQHLRQAQESAKPKPFAKSAAASTPSSHAYPHRPHPASGGVLSIPGFDKLPTDVQQHLINDPANLQPMLGSANCSKGCKVEYNGGWITWKGEPVHSDYSRYLETVQARVLRAVDAELRSKGLR